MKITNLDDLVANSASESDRASRRIALEVMQAVLHEADPVLAIKKSVDVKSDELTIQRIGFNLKDFERIYVIGGGKAGGGMARAVEDLLGSWITDGVMNIPIGTKDRQTTSTIKLNESSHPIPSEAGLESCNRMLEIAGNASKEDLVVVLISGGASALLPLPAGGLTLKDLQDLTGGMLRSGSTIDELNAVRKHLSGIKGGRLAQACHPATVITLIISDVVGDPLDVIASGPTVPDRSTYGDAIKVLEKYGLLNRFPNVKEHLMAGLKGRFPETLKEGDPTFERVHNFLISTNKMVLKTVVAGLSKKYDIAILSTELKGKAREAGRDIGRRVMVEKRKRVSGSRPRVMLLGGETTVTVKGMGKGGRNQELVLSAMLELKGDGLALASIGTDGVDGTTDAAGAIADGKSLERTLKLDLDPMEFLDNNDSYNLFRRLKDLIYTGPTGTNINDIIVTILV